MAEQSSLCWRAPAWAQDLPPGPAGHSTVRARLRVCVPLQSQADQRPQPLSMQSTTCREESQRALLADTEYWLRGDPGSDRRPKNKKENKPSRYLSGAGLVPVEATLPRDAAYIVLVVAKHRLVPDAVAGVVRIDLAVGKSEHRRSAGSISAEKVRVAVGEIRVVAGERCVATEAGRLADRERALVYVAAGGGALGRVAGPPGCTGGTGQMQ